MNDVRFGKKDFSSELPNVDLEYWHETLPMSYRSQLYL